ncbi:hypothetical protein CFN16_27075 [Pseudomonas fluorescens]|uniref:Uncharacterized protein n=1 Tax=Pseudomonas fluorescens TaxID=294 RepID=A0A345V4L3_PSEFL|nr:hypothetical protein [Pseudomonas fluorescens]AXJ07665.1 hypothetical protein CFN16_27075 [Pseudomonas fluorescens]
MPDPVYYPGAKNALKLLEKMLISTQEHPETPANKKSRDWLLHKHNGWENSITGIAMGYYVESAKGLKHLKKKNFAGSFSEKVNNKVVNKNRGDITTTTNKYSEEGKSQGKVIQLKHTICDKPSAVNNAIRDAFTQLSGQKGEVPLADDILIADIFIASPNNAWPFDGTGKDNKAKWIAHNYTFSISQFVGEVKSKITEHLLLADYKKNYAAAKAERDIELQCEKAKRSFSELYIPGETFHAAGLFDSDIGNLTALSGSVSNKLLCKNDKTSQKASSDVLATENLIEEPSPVSKKNKSVGQKDLTDYPSLVLKLNFTTGRKILFENQQEPTMVNKIVLSVRWTSGELSVKFVREKPVS